MNRRQQQRRQKRRAHHEQTTDGKRPRLILDQDTYPEVKSAHIVPRMYQRAWAVDGQIAVHVDRRDSCVLMSTRKAGTRGSYYRRRRPDGKHIDDVEACLAALENKASPPLERLRAGQAFDLNDKSGLAQLFAVQMLRGPAFFEQRMEILEPLVALMQAKDCKRQGLTRAGGQPAVARQLLLEAFEGPTSQFMTMLQTSVKMGGILANMRWQMLRFAPSSVVYSDHPVVLWPASMPVASPFKRQGLGPVSAFEIRIPVAPDAALLLNWIDCPDAARVELGESAAAELNAFTIGQADRQWMHMPGFEPLIARGEHAPLSRLVEPHYSVSAMEHSVRRTFVQQWLAKVGRRRFVNDLQVVDFGYSS